MTKILFSHFLLSVAVGLIVGNWGDINAAADQYPVIVGIGGFFTVLSVIVCVALLITNALDEIRWEKKRS